MLLAVPAGLLVLAPAAPWVLGLALALDVAVLLVALADALLAVRPHELTLRRVVADKLSLGVDNLVRLLVRSDARRPARLSLTDDPPPEMGAEPAPALPLSLAPRSEDEARYHVKPRRRGDYRFGVCVLRSSGPLGLMRWERAVDLSQDVRVYPNLLGIERWKLALRRNRTAEMGLHVIRKRGSGTEFEKLRPYVAGDEMRHVDWKATARRRAPVTRVFETERSQTITILIDSGRQMAPWVEGLSRLDYAVNAALLLAYVAGTRDDKVGLAVFSDEVASWLEPRKGARQYRRFMEALYRVEAESTFTDYIGAAKRILSKQKKRSLVVIFTDIADPESLRELYRALSLFRPNHLPLVVALRDPSFQSIARSVPAEIDGVYEKVVAREVLEERARAVRELVKRGAHVLDVLPQDFSAAVVSRYLELKARGAL